MLKIGIKLPTYNLDTNINSLHLSLAMLRDIGFSAIEFTPETFNLIQFGNIDKTNFITLKTILEKYNFEKVLHTPLGCNLFNQQYFESHKKILFATCELCYLLNAKTLVFHPGRSYDNVDFTRFGKPQRSHTFCKELIQLECTTIQEAADNFPEVTIAMENLRPYANYSPYSYAEFCGELANIVKYIDRLNVRVALDTGHLNLASSFHNLDIHNEIMSVRNLVSHCHILDIYDIDCLHTTKDRLSMHSLGIDDEHTVPGRGTFPMNDFFMIMSNFSGIITIELTNHFYSERIKEAYNNGSSFLNIT